MSDPYTDLLAQPSAATGAAGGDPYGALLGVDNQQQRFKSTLNLAVSVPPEQAAQQRNLAKQLNTPVAAVEALPDDAKRAAAIQTIDANTANAPVLRRKYTEADFAKLAHDDSGVLSSIESVVKGLGKTARYLVSADDDASLTRDIAAGYFGAGAGAAGLFRAGTEAVAPVLDFLEADPTKPTLDWRADMGGNPLRRLAEGFALAAQQSNANQQYYASKTEGNWMGGLSSGVQSLTQNLMLLPAALLTGGESAVLTGMVSMTGGNSYEKSREAGKGVYQSLAYGASDAVVEYATEKLPMHQLMGDLKAGTGLFKTLIKNAALEVPGEQIATILQDANEWATLHPEKSVGDYLRERPDAAVQTLIATLVGTGGQVSLMHAVQKTINNATGNLDEMQRAEQFGQQLEALFGAANESALRTRAPDTFAEAVQAMADENGGAPSAVYMDARTLGEVLNQSGLTPEQLSEMLPSVVSQLQDAIAQNGTVEIPVGELAAAVPGTPLEQSLLPHLRSSPEALSQVEAQDAQSQAGEFIKNEAERVMAQAADRQALEQSADAVRTTILDQLNQAGRFRPEANAVYADMVRAFYATMAQRTGVTPEELYAKYPLRVAAEGTGGLAQSQKPRSPEFKAWYEGSKVKSVVYHATGNSFDTFDTSTDRSDLGAHFGTEEQANKVAGGMRLDNREGTNVMPVWLSIKNPLRLKDVGTFHADGIADQLERKGLLPKGDGKRIIKEIDADWKLRKKYDPLMRQAIEDAGYDGVVYANTQEGRGDSYIAFNPEQIKSATGNDGTFDANDPSILSQTGTRATFSPEQMLIVLGQNADLSSFLHESGHFFLEVLADLGTQPGAPEQIAKDIDTVLAWFGIPPSGLSPVRTGADKSVPDRVLLDAQRLADLGVAQPTGAEGSGFFGAEPFLGVFGEVSRVLNDPEIFRAVVAALPVDVVDMLGGEKLAAEQVLHDPAMLQEKFTVNRSGDVAIPADRADALVTLLRTVASVSAERSGVSDVGGAAFEGGAAAAAGKSDGHSVDQLSGQQEFSRLNTWNRMTLEEKRAFHERFAESVEQYFFEGRAPSVELRGVFDRFRTWLTSVYKSLKRFLAMREQTPGGQAAAPGELNQAAYHGTPYRGIEKFSTDKIGTGEGAQAYGWGLYFAQKKDIADYYRRSLSRGVPVVKVNGRTVTGTVFNTIANRLNDSLDTISAADVRAEIERALTEAQASTDLLQKARAKEMAAALKKLSSAKSFEVVQGENPGQLYEVDIPEDDTMLLWDKPLSEQPEAVRKALEGAGVTALIARGQGELDRAGLSRPYGTGEDIYRELQDKAEDEGEENTQRAASEALAALGVKGIKYLDGTSRGAGDGTFNYVVFSGDDVAIKNQFYQSDAPAAGPLGLSDEVRQVMDRLLATDEQIAEAERVRNYGLLFKSPEEAGMTPEQWAKYISDDEKAHAEALNELGKKSLKNLGIVMRKRMRALREVQADMAEKRKAVEAEAAEQIAKEPVYQAMRWLKNGEMVTPEGEEIKVTDGFKLDAVAVNAIFPESMPGRPDIAKLKGMMRKTEGMDPSIVAEMFGFRDAAHLITSIVEAFPQADQVQGLTDQMMLERYGEDATPRGMERAADAAVHNENRARVLAAEMAAVNAANNARAPGTGTRTVNAMVEAAKQFAANLVGRKLVKDLKPNVHTAAETRAARAAEKALAEGDTAAVIQAKRDQLLNFHAARATNEARIETAKVIGFFKKVATAKDDVVGKTRDIDVVKAAQAILAAYGVGTKGQAAAEYLAVLERNDPAMFAAVKPSIEAALINAKPVDQLTLDELRALNEEVQALWYLAKRSRQMEVDGNLLDRQDIEDDLKARMQVIGIPANMPGDTSAITPAEQRALKLKGYLATARRVESWARGLDGSKGIGPFTRFVWQPVKEAANAYRTDKAKYLKAFRDLLKAIEPTLTKRQIEAPELNYTFGKDTDGVAMTEMLHALLHTGNESNKRKLLLGRKWATENEDGTLDTRRWDAFVQRMVTEGILQPVHFDFAQGVWDLLEQTKPLAQKAHRDVFGRYFAEVIADKFTDPFGVERRGGYVPAQADPRIVSDAATKRLMEDENASMQFAFPSTNKGFTKGRVEYNRPLMLDLRSIAQHIDKVLLFSHMEQPVRDVRKVLTAKGVAYGLNRIDPVAFDNVLTPWLNRAAKQQVATPAPNNWQGWRFWTTLRNRAGMAAMFGNVANAVQQFAGFSLAAVRVKPSQLMSATAQYVANPKQTAEMVSTKSEYMNERFANEVANMNDAINEILLNPNLLQEAQRFTSKHAYFLQSAIDNVMGPIIWTGAYNQALAEGMEERDAIRKADAAVRETQGSTAPEDVSAIEGGTAFARLFNQFAGYFNMQANLLGTEFQTLAREMGLRKGMGRGLYVLTFGFLVNAWVAEAIMQLFKGGPDDDDKDGEFLDDWLKQVFGWSMFRNVTAAIPVFGQGINALVNATNDKPYDDRLATSPAISMLESAAKAPVSVYKAAMEDGKVSKAIKDVGTLIALTVGIPLAPITKPLGYAADVEQGKVSPTSPADAVRGAVTGSPSGPSKNR